MGLGGCFRVLLIIENLIFWLVGIALVAFSSYILLAPEVPIFLQILQGSQVICYVAIALGVILFVIGFLGCLGAFKENTCLLKTYACLVIVVALLEVGGAVLIWQMEEKLLSFLHLGWTNLDDTSKNALQQQFACCGLSNQSNTVVMPPPTCSDPNTGETFQVGCYDKLKEFISGNIIISASIGGGIVLLQVISIIAACALGKHEKPAQVRPMPGARNAWGGYA
ncbi:leukocyte surface antigen CD53-like [Asterias amurensis]|uniref:leukocyte surface antigen CD53-like n=1 Tax=Asterias amurensis TaxID=7602 RepID=UPI003AB25C71